MILTAEEIVPPEVIRSDPNRTLIPGFIATPLLEGVPREQIGTLAANIPQGRLGSAEERQQYPSAMADRTAPVCEKALPSPRAGLLHMKKF